MSVCPSIGIMMAARNAEATIVPAIKSVVEQDYNGRIHIVVVDDASSDETAALASSFESVEVIKVDRQVGRSAARNIALTALDTDLVAIQDADDRSRPYRFTESVTLLKSNPYAVVGGQMRWIDPEKGVFNGGRWPTQPADTLTLLEQGRMPLPHPSMIVKRELLVAVNGYREQYPVSEDLDLLVRLKTAFTQVEFINSDKILVDYLRAQSDALRYMFSSAYWRHKVMENNPNFYTEIGWSDLAGDMFAGISRRCAKQALSMFRGKR